MKLPRRQRQPGLNSDNFKCFKASKLELVKENLKNKNAIKKRCLETDVFNDVLGVESRLT